MSVENPNFIRGDPEHPRDKKDQDFSLCCAYPRIDGNDKQLNTVLIRNQRSSRESDNKNLLEEDGLYVTDTPLTRNVVKPYQLNGIKMLDYESKPKFCGKLLEIAVREVKMHGPDESSAVVHITSVSLLFKRKVICKAKSPFNRKLYKLLIRNSECNNLSIQVHSEDKQSSILPLPLPRRCIKDSKIEIDFAIGDNHGKVHAGTVLCTISLNTYGPTQYEERSLYYYRLSNDPNDPQNSLSLLKPRKSIHKEDVNYFLLEDPALSFYTDEEAPISKSTAPEKPKSPDIVLTEHSTFSLLDVSFRNLFQVRRPLRPSSGTHRHHTIGKALLTVTVLRGVEVPVREESALVQPFIEIEWGNVTHSTAIADGPAPIWQQTVHFELPRQTGEYCVKFHLYDQHPVWGQQWLGDARIPLEYDRNYQELERWIPLSPLSSPVLLFGYVQASPGQSYTRLYVLIKMEQPGNAKSMELSTINTLSKGIQRCLNIQYKINGIEDAAEAARLAMLLSPLPMHYGPITPGQALNVNKVDHYGRAALLATLLQGFDLQSYVLLGSSQISKWAAFVVTVNGSGNVLLWDSEVGDHYVLGDSRCSLTKVSRLINQSGIWENLQKSILPHNLKYDVKAGKDWRPLGPINFSSSNRAVQVLDLNITPEDEQQDEELAAQIEQHLKDKLSQLRSGVGLTTIFNRHAMTLLQDFISKIEDTTKTQQLSKKDLKQLYTAYHTHGFILNLRQSSLDDLTERIVATKVHNITGPVEFALVCHVQRYVGKVRSIWLALVILRNRDYNFRYDSSRNKPGPT